MMTIHSPVGKRRRIPLTPLIDVIFILIMFFLLSSSFGIWRSLEVSLESPAECDTPQISAAQQGAPSVVIVLRATSDDASKDVTVNGQDLALSQLAGELNRLADAGGVHAVLLPEKGVSFQKAVRVLDEARSSRIKRVSLQLD